jgi:hypothetical protein
VLCRGTFEHSRKTKFIKRYLQTGTRIGIFCYEVSVANNYNEQKTEKNHKRTFTGKYRLDAYKLPVRGLGTYVC